MHSGQTRYRLTSPKLLVLAGAAMIAGAAMAAAPSPAAAGQAPLATEGAAGPSAATLVYVYDRDLPGPGEEGYEQIDSKDIILDNPIREIGEHTFRVSLAGDVEAEVELEVVPG